MRRIRRTQALLLALAVSAGILFTAAPALAAPAANARLTLGAEILPGSGRTYGVQVTNSGTPIIGETINAVRILLPAQTAGVKNSAAPITGPGSWTATRVSSGNLQSILFKGGTIAPGSNTTFTFPADVAMPPSADRSGLFQVQLSSNGGQDSSNATVTSGGTLTTAVRTLEVPSPATTPSPPPPGLYKVVVTACFGAGNCATASTPITIGL